MSDAIKRIIDFFAALLLIALLSPLLIALAIAVLVVLGRPVLFVQQRPGRHGRMFRLLKFRSMRTVARPTDAKSAVATDADRLTRFGEWLRSHSLDELPSLLNVITGDMSLVGPRPLLPEYLPLYSPEQARRHEVRPGITGWAQVNGRNATDWNDRLAMDVWYVDNRSLSLDARIVFMTIRTVLSRSGVSAPGEATMHVFEGSTDSEEERCD